MTMMAKGKTCLFLDAPARERAWPECQAQEAFGPGNARQREAEGLVARQVRPLSQALLVANCAPSRPLKFPFGEVTGW